MIRLLNTKNHKFFYFLRHPCRKTLARVCRERLGKDLEQLTVRVRFGKKCGGTSLHHLGFSFYGPQAAATDDFDSARLASSDVADDGDVDNDRDDDVVVNVEVEHATSRSTSKSM